LKFLQYFYAILYPSQPLTTVQNFSEIIQGKPSIWGKTQEG